MELSKNKALELYNQSAKYAHSNIFSFREESHNTSCKKLAKNIVDEVLKELDKIESNFNLDLYQSIKFWKDVKTEIDNIKPIQR